MWLDDVIGFFSPMAGFKRRQARMALEVTRSYEGAKTTRRTDGWYTPSSSANTEIYVAGRRLRDRARDIVRNNPYGKKARRIFSDNFVGTGITAPRSYIFLVIEKLREVTGLGLSRAENMVEATANADCFVEVSGILNAAAVNLIKVSDDLRRLVMLGEIKLPAVQAGSSIMPGKVNPVILESVIQIGIKVKANNNIVADCASRGSLQICEFMPLLADALLESIDLLIAAAQMLAKHATGIDADQGNCLERLYASPEIITAFVPMLGYDRCSELFKQFEQHGMGNIREFLEKELGKETVEKTLSPQNLMSLGYKD